VLQGALDTLVSVEVLLLECSVLRYNLGAPLALEVLSFARSLGFELFDVADYMDSGSLGAKAQYDFVLVKASSWLFDAAEKGLIVT
jgi:hypothetical protein